MLMMPEATEGIETEGLIAHVTWHDACCCQSCHECALYRRTDMMGIVVAEEEKAKNATTAARRKWTHSGQAAQGMRVGKRVGVRQICKRKAHGRS